MNDTNSTSNSNVTSPLLDQWKIGTIGYILLALGLLIGILICCGNLLTIASIPKLNHRMKLSDMNIISLAMADFFGGILLIVYTLIYLTGSGNFFARNMASCMTIFAVLYTSALESAFTILLIAFDRFLYLVKPYVYQRIMTSRRIKISIGISWTISLCLGCVTYVWNRFDFVYPCGLTDLATGLPMVHLAIFSVCFVMVCIFYGNIILVTITQEKELKFNFPSTSGEISKWRFNKKSTKLFLTVTGTFFCCWLPFLLVSVLKHYMEFHGSATLVTSIMAMLNCGMNVIIYTIMNPLFRGGVKSLFIKRQQVHVNTTTTPMETFSKSDSIMPSSATI